MSSWKKPYLAGLFDGEGTFSIQVMKRVHAGNPNVLFGPRMSMSLKYGVEALDVLVEEFGGKIYDYGDKGKKWSLGKRAPLIVATKALLPFLTIKKDIAERFLKALKMFPDTKRTGQHLRGIRSWDKETTLAVAEIAMNLNPYKKSKKTEKFVKELERIYDAE